MAAGILRFQGVTSTEAGIAGIESILGTPFPELLEDYAAAAMHDGPGASPGAPAFTSYAFPSAVEAAGGPTGYPWAVTGQAAAPFSSAVFSGSIGESGLRIHDFQADGDTPGVELHLEMAGSGSLVIVRLQ